MRWLIRYGADRRLAELLKPACLPFPALPALPTHASRFAMAQTIPNPTPGPNPAHTTASVTMSAALMVPLHAWPAAGDAVWAALMVPLELQRCRGQQELAASQAEWHCPCIPTHSSPPNPPT